MSKKEQARVKALLPSVNGVKVPRWIRVYDNGGETADRYTIVFTGRYRKPGEDCIYVTASELPTHPAYGIYQHGYSTEPIDTPKYSHLGKKITFWQLPKELQACIRNEYADLWDIK